MFVDITLGFFLLMLGVFFGVLSIRAFMYLAIDLKRLPPNFFDD